LYALSRCNDDEALEVEAHLLDCDLCFDDLRALDRTGALLREYLAPTAAHAQRLRDALGGAPSEGGGDDADGSRAGGGPREGSCA
jgi:anti-sigma factor RsiW